MGGVVTTNSLVAMETMTYTEVPATISSSEVRAMICSVVPLDAMS
ncbi:MAG: hypothetical protein ACI9HK_000148 [Pirellulaceae bacterium]|jgi:hypothetical protein